jgi:hypothetical protein
VATVLLLSETATLAEIDEALTHAQQIPADQRGPGWYAFTDRLLEMRAHQQNTGATH